MSETENGDSSIVEIKRRDLVGGDVHLIMHLSDLHFGVGEQEACWSLVARCIEAYKPELVVITGDIAQSPNAHFYESANRKLRELGVSKVRVCAGNHDRFPMGLNAGRWIRLLNAKLGKPSGLIEETMTDLMARREVESISVGTWNIGIASIDSSQESDLAARGYARTDHIQELEDKLRSARASHDLLIVLVHHHLLQIPQEDLPAMEDDAFMGMKNGGALLQSCARGGADFVLHGHKHIKYLGRHSVHDGAWRTTTVISAGSATGASAGGCKAAKAALNLLSINPQGNVALHALRYDTSGSRWIRETVQPLATISPSRWPVQGDVGVSLPRTLSKVVEFEQDRDIRVAFNLSRIQMNGDGRTFKIPLYNSTGTAKEIRCELLAGESKHELKLEKKQGRDNYVVWTAETDNVPATGPLSLRFGAVWLRGGLLTNPELTHARSLQALGLFRQDGYEFAGVPIRWEVDEAHLTVKLPRHYRPTDRPTVRVVPIPQHDGQELSSLFRRNARFANQEQQKYEQQLLDSGSGVYSLHVQRPVLGLVYALCWYPASATLEERAYHTASRIQGAAGGAEQMSKYLVDTVLDLLEPSDRNIARISIYYRSDPDGLRARHSIVRQPNGRIDLRDEEVQIGHHQHFLSAAFWGGQVAQTARMNTDGMQLQSDEGAFYMIPLYAVPDHGHDETELPWAVLRVARTSSGGRVLGFEREPSASRAFLFRVPRLVAANIYGVTQSGSQSKEKRS